jgi:catechol 2,3-dioxygenase-like lactoylglutathione lyase family enzyme
VIRRPALWLVLCAALLPAQSDPPVSGVGPFLHIVADLDQSLAFYHDRLGLELSGPPGEHKFTDNPAVANLYGVPGKQFRAAVLKIAGSPMGIELVQWSEAREPRHKGLAGPGTATLILRRTDADADRKTLIDPDGFPIELERSDAPGAALSVSVADPLKTAALYESSLGLRADRIRFTEVQARDGEDTSFPEPGRGMLRLFVHHIDSVAASLKNAGFSVITTGGEPVVLPQGPRVMILRDPSGFFLQPMENGK